VYAACFCRIWGSSAEGEQEGGDEAAGRGWILAIGGVELWKRRADRWFCTSAAASGSYLQAAVRW